MNTCNINFILSIHLFSLREPSLTRRANFQSKVIWNSYIRLTIEQPNWFQLSDNIFFSLLDQFSKACDLKIFIETSKDLTRFPPSLVVNDTWDLIPLPGGNLVRCKLVHRTRCSLDGSVERHNTYIVDKSFSTKRGWLE